MTDHNVWDLNVTYMMGKQASAFPRVGQAQGGLGSLSCSAVNLQEGRKETTVCFEYAA